MNATTALNLSDRIIIAKLDHAITELDNAKTALTRYLATASDSRLAPAALSPYVSAVTEYATRVTTLRAIDTGGAVPVPCDPPAPSAPKPVQLDLLTYLQETP